MSDYGGLGGIIREAQREAEAERTLPLVDCPECGSTLQVNRAGEKNCPMGHFRTKGGGR